MSAEPTREELEAAACWERDDEIRGRPDMTGFRRRARLHQARWREAHGHPAGSQPIVPKPGAPARAVGNRLPLAYGQETGATFLTPAALDAARQRTAVAERHQSFDHQRLWADLLWSPALAFNLFGDLAADLALADRAVHAWWPDVPGTVVDVRFAHSPGRLDPAYLNSLRAWDAAFYLDLGGGTEGVLAVAVAYHELAKAETPKPENLARYREVAERSGAFAADAIDVLAGRSPLAVTWLEHLLLLSLLQHPERRVRWGRYVVARPAGNPDVAELCARYAALLADSSTFAAVTLEELLAADALPRPAADALRSRYLFD